MKVKKIWGILISLMMIALFTGCGSGGGGQNSGAVLIDLKLAVSSATTPIGSTYELPSAKAIYDNDEEKEVEVKWTPSVVDTSKAVTQVYKASYTENGVTKVTTFTLTVKANSKLVSIKLNSETGIIGLGNPYTLPTTATAEYEDGKTATVTVKWNGTADTSTEGDKEYVASYTENGVTVTTIFTLTVEKGHEDKIKSLAFATDSITVNKGDKVTLPTTATATYESLNTKTVTVKWTNGTTADTTVAGTKTYTASYTESYKDGTTVTKEATYTVTVIGVKTVKTFTIVKTSDTVGVGEKYTLPATGTLTYDDATTETVNITWDKTVSTATAGTNSYTGSCSKTTLKVTFKLTVEIIPQTENKIEVNDATVNTNSEFEITVSGTSFKSNAMGVDVTLSYDSNYIEVARNNGVVDESIVTVVNSGFLGSELKIVREPSLGKIQVALITMNGSKVNLDGAIFKIKFKSKSTAKTSTVSIVEGIVSDEINSYISGVNISDNGIVTINGGTTTTEPTFEISDSTVTASGYINVKISGKNFKETVSGADFTLEYDSNYLSLEGESDVTFLNDFAGALKIVQNKSGKLIISGAATGNTDYTINGDIVNIKFKASATKGATAISVLSANTAVISGDKQITTNIKVSDKGEITIK